MPALMGVPAPADTGIDGKDNKTVAAFETRRLTCVQLVAELTKSFAFIDGRHSRLVPAFVKLKVGQAGHTFLRTSDLGACTYALRPWNRQMSRIWAVVEMPSNVVGPADVVRRSRTAVSAGERLTRRAANSG